jgi:deazaflavin-dependent oxidoreductase (nitroreductase family)
MLARLLSERRICPEEVLTLKGLLDDRFLLLTHIGRRSGLPRQTVLEIVHHDHATETYFIASGWGEKPDWLRNIQKMPRVVVTVGRKRFAAMAMRLSTDEAARVLLVYAQRRRRAFRALAMLIVGQRLQDTEQDCRLLAQSVPLIALRGGVGSFENGSECLSSGPGWPRPGLAYRER